MGVEFAWGSLLVEEFAFVIEFSYVAEVFPISE